MKYSKSSVAPGGALPVVKNASRVLGPKAIISVGTCIGLNSENVKIGDIVVSSKLTTPAFRTPVSRNFGNIIRHASDGWKAPLENPDEWQVQVHRDADVLSQGQYEDEGKSLVNYSVLVNHNATLSFAFNANGGGRFFASIMYRSLQDLFGPPNFYVD